MIGERFGSWTVIEEPKQIFQHIRMRRVVFCKCVCGVTKNIRIDDLLNGQSTKCVSCGKRGKMNHLRHGESKNRLHVIWTLMKGRCHNQNNKQYGDYGGRGITVCDEWRKSYESFSMWAKSNGYNDYLQIDRRDNNGIYSPDNCRWVDGKTNCRNTRRNKLISAFGEVKCLTEWVEDSRCNISNATLNNRINVGWIPEVAITKPVREGVISWA